MLSFARPLQRGRRQERSCGQCLHGAAPPASGRSSLEIPPVTSGVGEAVAARHRRRARSGSAPAPRERVGHEAPGVALHGPPLTLTCACGRRKQLRYGDVWVCDSCGQTWDTSRIPRDEYNQIRRTQLRFRALPIAVGVLVVAGAAFFTLNGYFRGVVLLLPIALLSWFFMRGVHRKRYRAAIAKRQRWSLRGER